MLNTISHKGINKKNTPMKKFTKGMALTSSTLVLAGVMMPLFTTQEVSADGIYKASNVNKEAFLSMVAGYAKNCAANNDLYASVMIAQAILESGWGTSQLSTSPNYNLFGIKGSYQGQSVTIPTAEYINGKWTTLNEPFKKYPSYYESFQDNANVLRNTVFAGGTSYYAGAFKSNTNSYKDATAYLTGRYATDPSYGQKLNNLIASYNLTQYDTPANGNGGNVSTPSNPSNPSATGMIYYTVKPGDGLWRIAQNNHTTVSQLKSWNKLSSDWIYPNQVLIVGVYTNSGSDNSSSNNSSSSDSSSNSSAGSSTGSTGGTTYTVQSGDSLWKISNSYGTTVEQIKSWNGLTTDMIHPGDVLIVSGGSAGTVTETPAPSNPGNSNSSNNSSNSSSSNTYTVKAGDGLWRIAQNNGLTVDQLKAMNNLTTDMIHPGDVLIVSGSGAGSSSSSNAATGSSYTVQKGDTLWGISQKNGLSVSQLKSMNNLTSDTIYLGQVLNVG